jgi:hypothetical protein
MSRHVVRSEVLALGEYEAIREPFRARVIEEKKRRRVKLGDRVTVLFESHDTVLLQVQEMLRTERISRENAVAHEIETYNTLLGDDGARDLGATLMIEIEDNDERVRFLAAAKGLAGTVRLRIGESVVAATIDPARDHADRSSAVVYLVFSLDEAATAALERVARNELPAASLPVTLSVDHPAYQASATLSAATVASLAGETS